MLSYYYEAATQENNLGVAALELGEDQRALEHFNRALRFTMGDLEPAYIETRRTAHNSSSSRSPQSSADEAATTSSSCEQQEAQRQQASTSEAQAQNPAPAASAVPATTRKPSSQSPPTTFVYARGINLIPCRTAYSPDPLINTTIVSSITIFNLSIVYHLRGCLEQGCSSESLLRLTKARALYQKSHNLLVDAGVPLGATGNPVIDVLSMALYNNLAHVSFEMSLYQDTKRYFEYLIRFALTVNPARYGDDFVGALLEQQKSSFLLNAIILQAPRLAPAA